MYWRASHKVPYHGAVIDCSPGDTSSILAIYGDETERRDWRVKCDGHQFPKPEGDLWGIVKDNLLEIPLQVKVTTLDAYQRHPDQWTGTLTGFFSTGTDGVVVKNGRIYSLFLNIDWKSGLPPRHLTNIVLEIKGNVLSVDNPDKYSLGYCDKFSAGVRRCDYLTYLRIGGGDTSKDGIGDKTCKLFQLIKGNPHQYCSIKLGT